MKRGITLFCLMAVVTCFAFSQEQNTRPNREKVTINGKLEWTNGRIAVKENAKTYYVSGVNKLIGFVDGLKEGAQVKLEGFAFGIPAAPEYSFFRADKITFNGKDYAFDNKSAGKFHHNGRIGVHNRFGPAFPMQGGIPGQYRLKNNNKQQAAPPQN